MAYVKQSKKLLIGLVLFASGMACQLMTPGGDGVTLPGCYRVTFLGFSASTDQVSTWRYRVEEQSCAQDLSNWMLELPACATVVDASPLPWEIVQPDPNYQFNGIKWETGTGFQSGEFSVVLSGELTNGTVLMGVKGPDVAVGEIEGPICAVVTTPHTVTTTPDVFTSTPLQTATVESIASPTVLPPTVTAPAATVQPPPASSGTILITDNDQTLTFTCNGNAVEVRGNANVIILLGSCSSITVRGNANQIYWQSGAPVITNTGNENIITQR
jgi:hypothetical protein